MWDVLILLLLSALRLSQYVSHYNNKLILFAVFYGHCTQTSFGMYPLYVFHISRMSKLFISCQL